MLSESSFTQITSKQMAHNKNPFLTETYFIWFYAFSSLVLGVFMLPPVQSLDSAESVSFPEEEKQISSINLPASLMWKAQLEGYLFIHW